MAKKARTEILNKKISAVAKWKNSGLSQAEFCRREGLEQWQLSEWKRVVGNLDKKEKPSAQFAGKSTGRVVEIQDQSSKARAKIRRQRRAKSTAESQPFVPVRLVEDGTPHNRDRTAETIDCVLEVVLKRGQIIRVAPSCAPQFLGAVVAILDL